MPLALDLTHRILIELSAIRREGKLMKYLRPDAKSQVTIEYSDDNKPMRIDSIVVSTQHDEFVLSKNGKAEDKLRAQKSMQAQIREDVINIVLPRVQKKLKPSMWLATTSNAVKWGSPGRPTRVGWLTPNRVQTVSKESTCGRATTIR